MGTFSCPGLGRPGHSRDHQRHGGPGPRRTGASPRMASMQLKTFRGNSMADALASVKRDLGSEAVILHARTIRVGGVIGFGAKNQYEITASAGAPGSDFKQSRIATETRPVAKPVEVAAPAFEPAKFANPTAG